MKMSVFMFRTMWSLLFIFLIMTCMGIASAVVEGEGKPKAVEIYIGDFPQVSSVGDDPSGDIKVIVDDEKYPDPQKFKDLGKSPEEEEPEPTETPTIAPTPTTTVVIPIDQGGVGKQLCVLDNTSDIIVDFAYSSAGYKNVFKLSSPKSVSLGWSQGEMPDNRIGTDLGTTWNLGKFTTGQELIFADTANGKTYYTGPGSRNPDKIAHAAITLKNATGTHHKYLVTFEDYWNGGDKDYNDLEFYVSGNLSTECSTGGDSGGDDSGTGAVVPNYFSVCRCTNENNEKEFKNKDVCVALFTYNSTIDNLVIPVRGKSLPWNEFTGSGMVEQFRCQPTTFYVDSSPNKQPPFWTNRFWNNIQWKLGYEHSILVKCQKDTPTCEELGYVSSEICKDC